MQATDDGQGDPGERAKRIARLVDDARAARESGNAVEDEAIERANPELMPALGEELRKLRRIQDARAAADWGSAETLEGEIQAAFGGGPGSRKEGQGTRIGPYKLLQLIGEGGFGVVYMAEQLAPVRRKVALKVIKPGMDSRQVLARFEAERQALAIMDHPNIAKVFDGGATASGRPYFVMEVVHGIPVTEFCDRNRLPPRDRLELFAAVCRAVQHAHQKGVIHRDLKPSNVRVNPAGRVVILDFGLAAEIARHGADETLRQAAAQALPNLRGACLKTSDQMSRNIARRRFGAIRDALHALHAPSFGKRVAVPASEQQHRRLLGLPT